MDGSDDNVTIEDLVGYCQTQARLLQGRVDSLEAETTALLSEIDDDLAAVRAQLNEHDGLARSQSPEAPEIGGDDELADLEAREAALTEKQAVAKAKQTRRDAFEALAVGYLELAEQLQAESPAQAAALKRILEFEHDRDAPAYFDDRVTMIEAAGGGSEE